MAQEEDSTLVRKRQQDKTRLLGKEKDQCPMKKINKGSAKGRISQDDRLMDEIQDKEFGPMPKWQ